MAKKIRLDFSKTEERSGWNTRAIPEGLHKAKITAVQETEAGDGTAMLVYALQPVDPKLKTRLFPYYCKLQQNQLWKLRDLLVAAGVSVPKKAVMIDPDAPVGQYIAIEVQDETGQYAGRSTVEATYGLDILDEDGDAADDSDEEEYDEESEEEADEDDTEDEEDEEEDLNDLSIAELRKRAKGLGIDHAGVKKADLIELILEEESAEEEDEDEDELDEDDLDDEELEDEEFEDDEEEEDEEPEPAPRRRASAAKAAPARKAAPAPARRTVKRR